MVRSFLCIDSRMDTCLYTSNIHRYPLLHPQVWSRRGIQTHSNVIIWQQVKHFPEQTWFENSLCSVQNSYIIGVTNLTFNNCHPYTSGITSDVRLHLFWQILKIPSENRWCSTFSLVWETLLPSPAWQLIQVWRTCAWKHAPAEHRPLGSSILRAWNKASSSKTRKRPTKVAMCARENSGKGTSDHMATTWQWDQVKWWKCIDVLLRFSQTDTLAKSVFLFIPFQSPTLLLLSRCRPPNDWFSDRARVCHSPATRPTSMERSRCSGWPHLARWDPLFAVFVLLMEDSTGFSWCSI